MLKLFIFLSVSSLTMASPILPMNKAFDALMELVPYLTNREKFIETKNKAQIEENLTKLEKAFSAAKHEDLLKQDLFAPTLVMLNESLSDSKSAFQKGKGDYAFWKLNQVTAHCLDCHSRLPSTHPSSFQEGSRSFEKQKFKEPFNLGLAHLLVRQYHEAKTSFTLAVDKAIIKKDFKNVMRPLKQLLLIQTKIFKDPKQMQDILSHYQKTKGLLDADKKTLMHWEERLKVWVISPYLEKGLKEENVTAFIDTVMKPLFKKDSLYVGNYDVDLLFASGLISNYLFENPKAPKSPELMYWLGMSEKYLNRENFFGSGDRFLKTCVQRYSKDPVAKKCFKEYKESMEFEFTGSRGTDMPEEVQNELKVLEKMIN